MAPLATGPDQAKSKRREVRGGLSPLTLHLTTSLTLRTRFRLNLHSSPKAIPTWLCSEIAIFIRSHLHSSATTGGAGLWPVDGTRSFASRTLHSNFPFLGFAKPITPFSENTAHVRVSSLPISLLGSLVEQNYMAELVHRNAPKGMSNDDVRVGADLHSCFIGTSRQEHGNLCLGTLLPT